MTNYAGIHDVGSLITTKFGDAISATAGGAGDATESNGAWVDRQGHRSAKLVIAYEATLGATETLSVGYNLQDADDASGTNAADFGTAVASAVVATGAAGGSTESGVIELDVDIAAARGFMRTQITPDLSAAGTDTATLTAVWVLGGSEVLPAA